MSPAQFRDWEYKSITLLGMSGVGKTFLAGKLRRHHWFHYSGDYRIGTRYLDEPILDNIKQQAMQVPFLKDLLRKDSIYIRNNISVHNLQPVSTFLGKPGNPELGGLPIDEFRRRQQLHREAEIAAMLDVPDFIRKAHEIYGYRHFINDAGGSLCELDDPAVIQLLDEHTLILYLSATDENQREVIRRAEEDPKPLYYRREFLDEQLQIYLEAQQLSYAADMDPDEFTRWVFPRLFRARIPRYESIAARYGYTVPGELVEQVQSEDDFLVLMEDVLGASST